MCSPLPEVSEFNPKIFYICKRKFTDPNKKRSPHKHDFIEIRYIFSGSCQYILDGVSYTVKAGDVVICNPNVEHVFKPLPSKESTIEFHIGLTDIHIKKLPKNHLCAKDANPIIHIPASHKQEFVKCCYEMLLEYENKKLGNDLMIKSLSMKFLILLFREIYHDEKNNSDGVVDLGYDFDSPTSKTYIVNTIISYFNENYRKKISLNKISQNMYLSPVYISKLFKEETGESPINYLIQLRLEKAKDILSTTSEASIKDIAKDVGYDDAYYFSKLFKKYYGVAPSHYKAN